MTFTRDRPRGSPLLPDQDLDGESAHRQTVHVIVERHALRGCREARRDEREARRDEIGGVAFGTTGGLEEYEVRTTVGFRSTSTVGRGACSSPPVPVTGLGPATVARRVERARDFPRTGQIRWVHEKASGARWRLAARLCATQYESRVAQSTPLGLVRGAAWARLYCAVGACARWDDIRHCGERHCVDRHVPSVVLASCDVPSVVLASRALETYSGTMCGQI
jgi:hypothetical protein